MSLFPTLMSVPNSQTAQNNVLKSKYLFQTIAEKGFIQSQAQE
jgi:hypothetical protein